MNSSRLIGHASSLFLLFLGPAVSAWEAAAYQAEFDCVGEVLTHWNGGYGGLNKGAILRISRRGNQSGVEIFRRAGVDFVPWPKVFPIKESRQRDNAWASDEERRKIAETRIEEWKTDLNVRLSDGMSVQIGFMQTRAHASGGGGVRDYGAWDQEISGLEPGRVVNHWLRNVYISDSTKTDGAPAMAARYSTEEAATAYRELVKTWVESQRFSIQGRLDADRTAEFRSFARSFAEVNPDERSTAGRLPAVDFGPLRVCLEKLKGDAELERVLNSTLVTLESAAIAGGIQPELLQPAALKVEKTLIASHRQTCGPIDYSKDWPAKFPAIDPADTLVSVVKALGEPPFPKWEMRMIYGKTYQGYIQDTKMCESEKWVLASGRVLATRAEIEAFQSLHDGVQRAQWPGVRYGLTPDGTPAPELDPVIAGGGVASGSYAHIRVSHDLAKPFPAPAENRVRIYVLGSNTPYCALACNLTLKAYADLFAGNKGVEIVYLDLAGNSLASNNPFLAAAYDAHRWNTAGTNGRVFPIPLTVIQKGDRLAHSIAEEDAMLLPFLPN